MIGENRSQLKKKTKQNNGEKKFSYFKNSMEMNIKWKKRMYLENLNSNDPKSLFANNSKWQATRKNFWTNCGKTILEKIAPFWKNRWARILLFWSLFRLWCVSLLFVFSFFFFSCKLIFWRVTKAGINWQLFPMRCS